MPTDKGNDWHAVDAAETARRFSTDVTAGLAGKSARERLARYGANELGQLKSTNWWTIFFRQFADVLILILAVAALVSLVAGHVTDAMAIAAILFLNGLLGFAQEWRAERAIEALRNVLEPRCRLRRDGEEVIVSASKLVPGDIVLLEAGDRVPADLRIVEAVQLAIDESVLTGESLPLLKSSETLARSVGLAERANMLWMGTSVIGGRGIAIAVATGMKTEFGEIARITQSVHREASPLRRQLATLGRQLGMAGIAIAAMVAVAGVAIGRDPLEMFMTGVSLAVAIVPEGLPAVLTLTLALGIRTMIRRRALLRRLQAAETLGAATVVCTDKTGTLTLGEMTVSQIWVPSGVVSVTGTGYAPVGRFEREGHAIDPRSYPDLLATLETGFHCNHAHVYRHDDRWQPQGAPTELALKVAAMKAGMSARDELTLEIEFAFSSERRRMTAIKPVDGSRVAFVKGAPETVLDAATRWMVQGQPVPMSAEDKEQVSKAYVRMARDGLRVIALAQRTLEPSVSDDDATVERDLMFVGLAGIIDPARPEVPDAVKQARSAGVRVLMITGDAPDTALAVAQSIGLPATRAITGEEIEKLGKADLAEIIGEDVVFARVEPIQKLRLIEALEALGEIVGMTGDGVNDAPALKRADIGIAMGIRGTDVARGASDIVLTDDNFASIVSAIEEGRRQYENIRKFVRYLLCSNIGEVIAIFLNVLSGAPLILLPVQILWVNLVTDGVTAVALGLEPAERDLMARPPRKLNARILDWRGLGSILSIGAYMGLATLWLFHYGLANGDVLYAQTLAFTGLIVFELFNVFNFRALRQPVLSFGLFSNRWLIVAWIAMIALHLVAVYTPVFNTALHTVPLSPGDWLLVLGLAAPVLVFAQLWVWFRSRKYRAGSRDAMASV